MGAECDYVALSLHIYMSKSINAQNCIVTESLYPRTNANEL